MRILTVAVILAAATATSAFAQERLTDTQYITAAKCRGLMQGADTAGIDAVLKSNKAGRVGVVLDRADTARKAAASKARKASGPGGKAEVEREIATACGGFTS
ncbi:MAG TPA: hypothetical protein PLO65_13695 [Caulobacter sp.]|nr:hypothetical protein [Caulobacter sp.]